MAPWPRALVRPAERGSSEGSGVLLRCSLLVVNTIEARRELLIRAPASRWLIGGMAVSSLGTGLTLRFLVVHLHVVGGLALPMAGRPWRRQGWWRGSALGPCRLRPPRPSTVETKLAAAPTGPCWRIAPSPAFCSAAWASFRSVTPRWRPGFRSSRSRWYESAHGWLERHSPPTAS
jgi:hypothetical protein